MTVNLANARNHLREVKKLNAAAMSAAEKLRVEQNNMETKLRDLRSYVDREAEILEDAGYRQNLSPEMIEVLRSVNKRMYSVREGTLGLLNIIALELRYAEAAREEFSTARKNTRDVDVHRQPELLFELDKGLAAADRYIEVLKEARSRGEKQLRFLDNLMDLMEERSFSAWEQVWNLIASSHGLALALVVSSVAGPAGLAFIGIAWPVIDFVVDFLLSLPMVGKYVQGVLRD